MQVCVLGAGIVGLATAWQLQREGHEVTVVDRATPGAGASGGNGAQLSYSYVQPLADPAIWRQLPGLLLSPSSPLKLRPALDPQQWRWGLQFLARCNARASRETTARLLALAALSRAGFEQMLADAQLDCDFSATGKLVLYPSSTSFDAARRQMDLQRTLGSQQTAVSAAECVALEPALASYQPQIAGAIHTPSECAVDCQKVCSGLHDLLRQRGVRFLLGTEVLGPVWRQQRMTAVATSRGHLEAERFVLSLGSASPAFARKVGVVLPVYPIKGYSITVDVGSNLQQAPRVSVTDSARKVVFARIGSRLRVAGMAELVGQDRSIPVQRIASLRASTHALFPGCRTTGDIRPWTGMRPATPSGLPIVGLLPGAPDNLIFNTGHGALGLTLAFGTARRATAAM
jgi:D-amino-acid dehydrogenase